MFEITPAAGWGSSLLWLGGVAVAAFLVSWLSTDRFHIRRTAYVGALTAVTGALTAGYALWSGAGSDVWTNRWLWGCVAGAVSGGVLGLAVMRVFGRGAPAPLRATTVAWEAAVYGLVEGLLLSVLPVVMAWQVFAAVGWTGGWRSAGAAVAALMASAAVIVVHHLGYREFRGRRMGQAVLGCSVLSVAYLLAASPLAAMLGHVLLHVGILRSGEPLPPEEAGEPPSVDVIGRAVRRPQIIRPRRAGMP